MPLINPTLPVLTQPDTTEDPKTLAALTAILNLLNGGLDTANILDGGLSVDDLAAAVLDAAGVSSSGVKRSGKSIIAASGSRTNVAYGALDNGPDRVAGVVLPTDGLLLIGFQALARNSVGNAGAAAIFIGGTQLKIASAGAAPAVQEILGISTTANQDAAIASSSKGLVTSSGGAADTTDVATGQIVGAGPGIGLAGMMWVFAAAGSYDVSVQFKASSGSVSAKNRKLWVRAFAF